MIMLWHREPNSYAATWRGQHLLLQTLGAGQWYLTADDVLVGLNGVPKFWPTARAAMNDIENRQQKIVAAAAKAFALAHPQPLNRLVSDKERAHA